MNVNLTTRDVLIPPPLKAFKRRLICFKRFGISILQTGVMISPDPSRQLISVYTKQVIKPTLLLRLMLVKIWSLKARMHSWIFMFHGYSVSPFNSSSRSTLLITVCKERYFVSGVWVKGKIITHWDQGSECIFSTFSGSLAICPGWLAASASRAGILLRGTAKAPPSGHTQITVKHGAITAAAFEVKTQNTLNKTDAYN